MTDFICPNCQSNKLYGGIGDFLCVDCGYENNGDDTNGKD